MAFSQTIPHAYPGFMAGIKVEPKTEGGSAVASAFQFRASTVGLQVKQEINYPDLIDGAIDKTVYALGPKIVEGDINFPLIHEGSAVGGAKSGGNCQTFNTSLANVLWRMAAERTAWGRLANFADITVCYPDNAIFTYPGCVVNSMSVRVNQGGNVEVTSSWIGGVTSDASVPESRIKGTSFAKAPAYISPARVVTWNDFRVACFGGQLAGPTTGAGFREFSCEIRNNVERYYTLNGSLAPQDITARKREISGTIKLLGRSKNLNDFAYSNEQRFSSNEQIAFGYGVTSGATTTLYWATTLYGVIFKMEELTINPGDAFESTINYNATGDCSHNMSGSSLGTTNVTNVMSASYDDGMSYSDATGFDGWEATA